MKLKGHNYSLLDFVFAFVSKLDGGDYRACLTGAVLGNKHQLTLCNVQLGASREPA